MPTGDPKKIIEMGFLCFFLSFLRSLWCTAFHIFQGGMVDDSWWQLMTNGGFAAHISFWAQDFSESVVFIFGFHGAACSQVISLLNKRLNWWLGRVKSEWHRVLCVDFTQKSQLLMLRVARRHTVLNFINKKYYAAKQNSECKDKRLKNTQNMLPYEPSEILEIKAIL